MAPLPKKALLAFENLTPKIDKPVNPKGARDVPQRAANAVAEAEVAIARREYLAAINRLERAVGFAPGNPRMHRALGMAYAGLLNRGKALDSLRKAVKGAPDDLEVQVLLGRLAIAQKQNAAAILSLRTALMCSEADDANPLVGEALLAMGTLLADEGYHSAALTCYERLSRNIERHGRDYASLRSLRTLVVHSETLLTRRGELLLKLRQPKLAADLLAKSRKRDRTSVVTARLLLKALLASKNVPGAVEVFHELAAETNMKSVAGQLAGQLCRISGDKSLPLELWRGRRVRGQYDGDLAVALARAAEELGAPNAAVTILQELLSVVPGDVVAGRALASIQAEQGKGDVALRVLAGLLAQEGANLSGARAGLAELAEAKLPDDFERKFTAGIKGGKPVERAAMFYAVGQLARLRGKGDLRLAAALLYKALEAKKDFLPAVEALAGVYIAQRRLDKVEEMLKSLSDSSADQYRVLVIRGRLHLTRGLARKAIADFEKARDLDGGGVELLLLLAEAYWQVTYLPRDMYSRDSNNDLSKARRALTAARKAAPDDVRPLWRLFRIGVEPVGDQYPLLAHGWAAAAELARIRPRGIEARLMQAELAIVGKKFADAKVLAAQLVSEAPAERRVQMLTVRLDVESNWEAMSADQRTALGKKARRFVVAGPGDIEATRLLTALLVKAGKAEQVPGIWQRLHRKAPGDLRVAVGYVEQLEKARKYSQAADVLAKVVQADPGNYFRLDRLVRLQIVARRYTDAAGRCEKALKGTMPASFASIFRDRLLALYEELKAYDKVIKLLDDMILTTGVEEALAALRVEKIRIHGLAGQIDQAHKYAMGWIEQEPNVVMPRMMLIAVLGDANQWDRAMKLVEGWLKARAGADKNDRVLLWCRQAKVRLLMRAEKYAVALKQAEAYLKLTPKDHEMLALKSNCLTECGRDKEAMAAMEKAYAIVPDDVQINNNLAYVYADNGVKLDKAERMVRKALAAMPQQVAYMDTLAWVFYKQGRIDAAIRKFELVLKRDDLDRQGHPVIFDHAGDAFHRVGKKDRAVKLWTRAIDLAKKQTRATVDIRHVLKGAAKKIEAVRAGKVPAVAPLGKGVSGPTKKAPDKPRDKPAPVVPEPTPPTRRL